MVFDVCESLGIEEHVVHFLDILATVGAVRGLLLLIGVRCRYRRNLPLAFSLDTDAFPLHFTAARRLQYTGRISRQRRNPCTQYSALVV